MLSGQRRYSHVRSGTCIALTAVGERPASECADPYGGVQLAAGASIVGRTRVLPRCRCATHHPRQMVPSKAPSVRRAALPAAARGRPQACAHAPRRCRVVSAARRSARSSAAFRAAHSALGVDRMSRLAAHSYGNLCARHARTHAPVSACGAVRPRRSSDGRRRRLGHSAHGGARARGAQCAMRKCASANRRRCG
jgi:hypothetical protein